MCMSGSQPCFITIMWSINYYLVNYFTLHELQEAMIDDHYHLHLWGNRIDEFRCGVKEYLAPVYLLTILYTPIEAIYKINISNSSFLLHNCILSCFLFFLPLFKG